MILDVTIMPVSNKHEQKGASMKILVTGGPVHAHLDAVKIITNRFRGGLMADLADRLARAGAEVIYLTARGAREPESARVLYHEGFWNYRDLVLKLAPECDAVVLGAAVCNLIPVKPWTGKFPSHQYQEGDMIQIPFQVAPRVVNMVKDVAPNTNLFAFKLLSDVPYEELIEAAYDIVLDARATCVFANDTRDLTLKYGVTKEHAVHPLRQEELHEFILELTQDVYYASKVLPDGVKVLVDTSLQRFWQSEDGWALRELVARFQGRFQRTYGKRQYVFGTVAYRINEPGAGTPRFVTTTRGKKELEDWCIVEGVNHETRTVAVRGPKKATLNAPLLDWIFRHNPEVKAIVHYHDFDPDIKRVLPYAPPGTVRDSQRKPEDIRRSFIIDRHGTFRLLRKGPSGWLDL